uniref:Anaphase-promoting complex subunit 4-like WD40 domain-containing protein n=1 Tax=Acrobeloides nanus TaxID=290746 RepID=A0A914DW40_9BILA
MAMLISEPTEDKDGTEHLCLQWHPCRDFLAVSSYRSGHGGEVNFFTKKGGKSFFVSKIAQNVRATKIAWHPSETILAVGWDNGRISIIDPLNKLEHDIGERDQDEICCMQWEERNSLLLVGDKNGLLVLYAVNLNHLEETKRHSRNQMNDELPVDICLKRLKSKSLLESQDHTSVLKNKELDEAEEQLLDAITKSKRYQALESSVEEAITTTDNTDMVTVFIIGGSKGSILIYLPQNGRVHKIFQAEHGIRQILDMPERIFLLAITDGLMFYQITVEGTKATEKIRVKLTGKREQFSMIQIDSDTIALCYGERDIRIWDLKNEDNALFRLTSEKGYGSTENVICLSYSPKKDCISGGTSEGKIANWRRRRELRDQPIDQQWRLQTATGTGMNIHTVSWSHTTTALAVNGIHSVSIFRDDSVLMHFDTEYAGVQSGSQAISLLRLIDPLETQEIQLPTPPKGIYIFGKNFGVWDEEQVQLYEIKNSSNTPLGIQPVSSFSAATKYVVIHGQSIFTLDKEKINIRTLQ